MGTAKAALLRDGHSWAGHAATMLVEVCDNAFEIGPGFSGLDVAHEDHPGQGPLPALASGWSALQQAGHDGPVIVLACDLPALTVAALRCLANWPGSGSVAPVLERTTQSLCARWSPTALEAAAARVAAGGRQIRGLLEEDDAELLDETWWSSRFGAGVFADADTPEDLVRLRVVGS